jgi:hypothetical protein
VAGTLGLELTACQKTAVRTIEPLRPTTSTSVCGSLVWRGSHRRAGSGGSDLLVDLPPPRTGLLEGIALKLAFSSRSRNAGIVLSSGRLIPVRLPRLSQQFQ